MEDKNENLLDLVFLLLITTENDNDWADVDLQELKDSCNLLTEEERKLPFVQCLIKGDNDNPLKVIETAKEFLYSDLLFSVKTE